MGEEDEAAIIHVLRNLPVAVNIWKRDDGYVWQCFEQSGIAENFTTSVDNGLHSLLEQLDNTKRADAKPTAHLATSSTRQRRLYRAGHRGYQQSQGCHV